ncbi:STAS domain-containing protein [Streptomyces sp. NPDC085639]|uniref:STAS domain-containing protein n=1 Tax=Streptomyces sp. NPDC085639 TaxID=3365734 RepID=UPI0037CDE245
MDVQRRGGSVLVCASGRLTEDAGSPLQQTLDGVTASEWEIMIDVTGVMSMDADGLLHLLDVHRQAECLGLRFVVVGWQPQPQRLMAKVAGIRGRGLATGERYAVPGFRRLLWGRVQRARELAVFGRGSTPTPLLERDPLNAVPDQVSRADSSSTWST